MSRITYCSGCRKIGACACPPRCAPMQSIPSPPPMPLKVPVGKLIRISPAMSIAGHIRVVFEDGSIKRSPVRTDRQILSMEFEPAGDSCPWDYDDPDEDAVFKPITPDAHDD